MCAYIGKDKALEMYRPIIDIEKEVSVLHDLQDFAQENKHVLAPMFVKQMYGVLGSEFPDPKHPNRHRKRKKYRRTFENRHVDTCLSIAINSLCVAMYEVVPITKRVKSMLKNCPSYPAQTDLINSTLAEHGLFYKDVDCLKSNISEYILNACPFKWFLLHFDAVAVLCKDFDHDTNKYVCPKRKN